MKSIRQNVLKLAHQEPQLRKHLVPLLRKAWDERGWYDAEGDYRGHEEERRELDGHQWDTAEKSVKFTQRDVLQSMQQLADNHWDHISDALEHMGVTIDDWDMIPHKVKPKIVNWIWFLQEGGDEDAYIELKGEVETTFAIVFNDPIPGSDLAHNFAAALQREGYKSVGDAWTHPGADKERRDFDVGQSFIKIMKIHPAGKAIVLRLRLKFDTYAAWKGQKGWGDWQ